MTALVTGATGNTGSKVVAELQRRDVPVRAFVRDRQRAAAVLRGDVEPAFGDLADPGSVRRAVHGAAQVFLLAPSGPEQVQHATAVIDAAAAEGVERLVLLSAVGAEAGSPLPFTDRHGRIEERLRAAGVPWTVLRTGFLMSNILRWVHRIRRDGRFFLPAGNAHVAMIDSRDVAAAAATVLTAPAFEERVHLLTGPEALTHYDMAKHLSDALGRPIEYINVPDEAAVGGMIEAGMPRWEAEETVALYAALRKGLNSRTTDDFRELTGRHPGDFAAFAREVAAPAIRG